MLDPGTRIGSYQSHIFLVMCTKSCSLIAVALLAVATPLAAHHWFSANFDASTPFTMTGTVTRFAWTNPHVVFHVDVANKKTGLVTDWTMEMGSPSSLVRSGWSKTTIKVGDTVTVEGIPARDGTPLGYARAVILARTGQRLRAAPGYDE